jgi:hypothetical protein
MHGYGDHNKAKAIVPVPFNSDLFPSFVGTYFDPKLDGTLIISEKDKKLWVSIREFGNFPSMQLIPIADEKFKADSFPSAIKFVKNKTGKTTGLILYDLATDTLTRIE